MKILVTGGAGYIGSIVVEQLVADGESVVVLDNLSQGHRTAVHPRATFVAADRLDRVGGLRYAALRYFNAAGASAERGEDHDPELHLIPIVLQVALGQRPDVTIFGGDYSTPDGTCVRDYIHVVDLAQAHVLALRS